MIDRGADDRQAERDVDAGQRLPRPVAGSTSKPSSLTGMCPWSWYIATTASYWPARSLTKTVSPGTGPTTSMPSATACAIVGARDVDVLPAEQPALAGVRVERGDGDAAARRCRGRAAPRASGRCTRRSRSGVSRFGTSSSATWVVTWLTRMLPCASSITEPRTPVSCGQHLGVAGEVVAGLVQRLLVQRRGDDGAGPPGLGQAHALLDRQIGEAPAIGARARRARSASPSGPACRKQRSGQSRRRRVTSGMARSAAERGRARIERRRRCR